MHATPEEWRPVVGWEGFYEVSDLGRVRTVPRLVRNGRGGYREVPQRIRKPAQLRAGYQLVRLSSVDKGQRAYLVHQLVLMSFVGPRPRGMEACHADGVKINNALSNLRWDTKRANELDAIRIGTRPDPDRTHCSNGHELSAENVYRRPRRGIRQCRKCQAEVKAQYVADISTGRRTVQRRYPDRAQCGHGHNLTPENIYVNRFGLDVCRECRRIGSRKYKAKKRAEGGSTA